MSRINELQIPDAAERDPHSFELLRVWVANKSQHVTLKVGVWQDPAAWGVMLCDLIQHIANAYQQDQGLDRTATLRRIIEGLDAELSSPTARPSGESVR